MAEFSEDYMPKAGLPVIPAKLAGNIHSVRNVSILKYYLETNQISTSDLSNEQKKLLGLT